MRLDLAKGHQALSKINDGCPQHLPLSAIGPSRGQAPQAPLEEALCKECTICDPTHWTTGKPDHDDSCPNLCRRDLLNVATGGPMSTL
eukprot:8675870-Lingulodinium_polyedra.AAC.1